MSEIDVWAVGNVVEIFRIKNRKEIRVSNAEIVGRSARRFLVAEGLKFVTKKGKSIATQVCNGSPWYARPVSTSKGEST